MRASGAHVERSGRPLGRATRALARATRRLRDARALGPKRGPGVIKMTRDPFWGPPSKIVFGYAEKIFDATKNFFRYAKKFFSGDSLLRNESKIFRFTKNFFAALRLRKIFRKAKNFGSLREKNFFA